MMTKLFNSSFEVSLRTLLLLSETEGEKMTIDRIVAYDFMAIYGRYFGLTENNLHGDNDYGFSELSARRIILQEAMKVLVLDDLVKATRRSEGFCYEIKESGRRFCEGQKTEYANTYRQSAQAISNKYATASEVELMAIINRKSAEALRR
jgi:hypothetical protein